MGVPSLNKTARAVVLPSFKGCYDPYGNCIRSFRDLIVVYILNENPRRTSFSIGQIEISALGVALVNNVLFALLNCKRTRTDNL